MAATITRYWHTIRYLRAVQIVGRVWFRLVRPRVDGRPAPPRRAVSRWIRGAERTPSLDGPTRMRLLSEHHDLADIGWEGRGLSDLARYQLHYFDDCTARDAPSRAGWHDDLIAHWIRGNPPTTSPGWEPYPTSLRIVNWIKREWQGCPLSPAATQSLAVQARWLSRRLEHHLQGNHLVSNAKALFFAGVFFDGPEAADWLRRAGAILDRQLGEQILPDGGQFERSPMYHALALEDVLDLCNAADAAQLPTGVPNRLASWRAMVAPMHQWLRAMCHPDGEIGLFNDAAMGVAPSEAALDDYARRLGFPEASPTQPVSVFPESGYVRVASGPVVALIDVGPVGPDYLPGHAHADTLSFELSAFGHRVLVNSGTSLYQAGPERLRQRGTAAHNTVTLNGEDSSEVWSAFRVARRARPLGLTITGGDQPEIDCAHDGYRRLPGRPVHRRTWHFRPGVVTIKDQIVGPFRTAQARFHLHPLIEPTARNTEALSLALPGGQRLTLAVRGGTPRIEASTWHPSFGVSVPSRCLVVDLVAQETTVTIAWDAS